MKESAPRRAKPEPKAEASLDALADLANRYPFRWFPSGEVAEMCGFGRDVMTELAELGAPIIAKKSNPHLLHVWLTQNVGKIGKIRGDKPSGK